MTDFPRELTEYERTALEMLLSVDFPGRRAYQTQLESAIVVERCACGCLEFAVSPAPDSPAADDGGVEVSAWSAEQQVHLALETRDGYLRGVSLMWFADDTYRLKPDLSAFELTVTGPEDQVIRRPPWWKRVRLQGRRNRLAHANSGRFDGR